MNENFRRTAVAIALAAASSLAQSQVSYIFSFTDLRGSNGQKTEDFTVTLTYPDYVKETGMSALQNPLYSASLGMSIAQAGTNLTGIWGFDDDGQAIIDDSSFIFYGNSFIFDPDEYLRHYLDKPGLYVGSVGGNAPFSNSGYFHGKATLLITAVPEPEVGALLVSGLMVFGYLARRRGALARHRRR